MFVHCETLLVDPDFFVNTICSSNTEIIAFSKDTINIDAKPYPRINKPNLNARCATLLMVNKHLELVFPFRNKILSLLSRSVLFHSRE